MKCQNCGFELTEDARFCGNCGEPVPTPSQPTQDEYINIGHPIGYMQIGDRLVYLIDNGLQQTQTSQRAFAAWTKLPQEQPSEENIAELTASRCLLNLGQPEQREKFMNCIPYRQGFGAIQDKKHVLVLGSAALAVSETQRRVWRLCDGKNTVERIGRALNIDEWDALEAVCDLVSFDLAYLKFAR